MPKFPKLFALNVPLNIVRSSRKEYSLKDGFFTPETYEDFYFFIRQGFLLEGDPDIKFNTDQKINFGMNDDDVRNEMAKRKGQNKEVIIDADFKDRCYSDFYKDIAMKVERGEMAAYPSDINERADAYYKEKLKEAESAQEEVDNPTSTIVDTTEPNSSSDENGPANDSADGSEVVTDVELDGEEVIPTPENTDLTDETATTDEEEVTTTEDDSEEIVVEGDGETIVEDKKKK